MPRLQANAAALGVGITIVEAALPLSVEEVFKKITALGPQAIYVIGDPYLWVARKQVTDPALETRLPTACFFAEELRPAV